jgi:hypothetical protein
MLNTNPKNIMPIALIIVAMLILTTVLFRYELVAISAGDQPGFAYRLDRWTGEIELILRKEKFTVNAATK